MVKPLTFKGDKKPSKKRKRAAAENDSENPPSKALTTTASSAPAAETADDDSWVSADVVSDISGPIIFVLPTDSPSCLSCDAVGKVFSLEAENTIEGDPSTAEPHDVRQVWIASRVAGTEKLSFKSHHGRYLSCDKSGKLSATTEAISPEESFVVIPVADNPGAFAIQTQRDKFFEVDPNATASDKTIRGDGESVTFNATLRIRMQARFKPKLKIVREEKAKAKISTKELEQMVGRKLEEDEVKMLKRARRDGNFHEKLLDVKIKGKHDKWA
jgi:protein FRG1